MKDQKIQFDIEELDYQKDAVNSLVDLFIDIPKVVTNPIYGDRINAMRASARGSGRYIRNRDITLGNKFLDNLKYVQFGNSIMPNKDIDLDKGIINLTVEMETGERVIIVTGCINALRSRVSGTLVNMIHALLRVIKYNYCKQCMRSKDVLALQY